MRERIAGEATWLASSFSVQVVGSPHRQRAGRVPVDKSVAHCRDLAIESRVAISERYCLTLARLNIQLHNPRQAVVDGCHVAAGLALINARDKAASGST